MGSDAMQCNVNRKWGLPRSHILMGRVAMTLETNTTNAAVDLRNSLHLNSVCMRAFRERVSQTQAWCRGCQGSNSVIERPINNSSPACATTSCVYLSVVPSVARLVRDAEEMSEILNNFPCAGYLGPDGDIALGRSTSRSNEGQQRQDVVGTLRVWSFAPLSQNKTSERKAVQTPANLPHVSVLREAISKTVSFMRSDSSIRVPAAESVRFTTTSRGSAQAPWAPTSQAN